MTVSAVDVLREYLGDGVTSSFPAPYVLRAEDLDIYVDGVEVPEEDTTVLGVGDQSGSTVVLGTAPASGAQVQVVRAPSLIQPAVFNEGARFPAKTNEAEQDRGRQIDQLAAHRLERSLRAVDVEPALDPLPAFAARQDNLPVWQAGNLAALQGLGDNSGVPMVAPGGQVRVRPITTLVSAQSTGNMDGGRYSDDGPAPGTTPNLDGGLWTDG